MISVKGMGTCHAIRSSCPNLDLAGSKRVSRLTSTMITEMNLVGFMARLYFCFLKFGGE